MPNTATASALAAYRPAFRRRGSAAAFTEKSLRSPPSPTISEKRSGGQKSAQGDGARASHARRGFPALRPTPPERRVSGVRRRDFAVNAAGERRAAAARRATDSKLRLPMDAGRFVAGARDVFLVGAGIHV